jgi:hypothetical protein
LDGSVDIMGSFIDFTSDAKRIMDSDVGLMQPLHPRGNKIRHTFQEIRKYGKDTQHNLNITRQWFHQQPDFVPEIPVYSNMYFGYDVSSMAFQRIADHFWSVYSTETGSWRDQPLWGYMLHHFNTTPLDFQGCSCEDDDNDGQNKPTMFKRNVWREGMNGHTYAATLEDDQRQRLSASNTSSSQSMSTNSLRQIQYQEFYRLIMLRKNKIH